MKTPLHERIRSDFERRILGGELAPGDRLPIEQDLMQEYGCSRMTVNKALSALVGAGLIERRKKAGTFVMRPKVHSMVLDVPDIAAQVRERGQDYAFRPIRRRHRPAGNDEEEILLAGGGALVQIDGLHLVDGAPLAVEFRRVSASAVPDFVDAELDDVPPGTWLLQHVPWTEAETRISAVAALGEAADWLGVAVGTPCLCVERRTWRGPERITSVRQIFLGDAYDLVARFGPTSQPSPS
ncbi:UTRA domain-containing protein [Novosphingobium decolorationis]|uniref:UTRA domain-containing protein n=1 Tax=Novosphingobium decolorationis TaxID=2698673 RepID=A0ABX8E4U8_9SPHN|nr:UTRA domain-containing protein [Novosphingobium decolorationis]QVM83979.1 UTRA domain-containing protein [Novosphingobium decolorationis]